MKKEITINLNGEKVSVLVEPNDILLDVLRNKLGMKSPKFGCGAGDCGTCTVLLNGDSIRSCLVLAVETDGMEIVTVEGLSKGKPTPLQEAFIEHNSFQCGFCAPGILINATELLEKNPKPSREEIQESIAGNLCRCTGYVQVVEAIEDVASKG